MIARFVNTIVSTLLLLTVMSVVSGFMLKMVGDSSTSIFPSAAGVQSHPDGESMYRLFHPAFPLEVLKPVSRETVDRLHEVKTSMPAAPPTIDFMEEGLEGLPWKVMPSLGITTNQKVWSRSEIEFNKEKRAHEGSFVWAHKLDRVQTGCLVVNHWKQIVVRITSYDRQRGARGVELGARGVEGRSIVWPPLSLEIELKERHWQPAACSPALFSQVLPALPPSMEKATWELILLLLLSGDRNGQHKEELQALFDTGLSPHQGFIAYLRLLRQVTERAGLWEDVPDYRKIVEKEIIF